MSYIPGPAVNVVADFQADPTGETDSSAQIQAAVNAAYAVLGTVLFPPGHYIAKNITLPDSFYLLGAGPNLSGSIEGVLISTPLSSDNLFTVQQGSNFIVENISFGFINRAFSFVNPLNSGGSSQGVFRWCAFTPTDTAIYMNGQNERIEFLGVTVFGGNYAVKVEPSGSDYTSFEKNRFRDCYFTGQAINALSITSANGGHNGNCEVIGCAIVVIGHDGVFIAGPQSAPWTWIDLNTEAAGGNGQTPVAPTTGAITASSHSLVVASATGLIIGRTITIQGAGSSDHQDLQTVIDNIVGTTITTHDAASGTVSGAEVIQAQYSTVNAAGNHVFMGCGLSGTNTAYSFTGGMSTFIATNGGRPAYQPDGPNFMSGLTNVSMRTIWDLGSSGVFTHQMAQGLMLGNSQTGPFINIPSPYGKDWWALMVSSNGDGTGTFGNFKVLRGDNSNQDLFRVDGTSGNAGVEGPGGYCYQINSFGTGSGSGSAPLADLAGSGSPNGTVYAQIGSTYRNTSGGSGTSFYVKESGAGTNTGWVGK